MLEIKQDEVSASQHIFGCTTLREVRRKLEAVYHSDEWWVYEGGRHVRLHQFPRKGLWAKLLGKGKPRDVFFIVKPA
jgi:hypothetical protein